MGNLTTTYQNIADILSYKSSIGKLEKTLSSKEFNWDNIVIEGSKHLVLPAIYCRLKSKGLLHLLPEELDTYLNEITSLNRSRNLSILKQIHALSTLFNEHKINHIFLKGAALIASGYYDDIAERMLGDIDILISEPDLDKAFTLLRAHGYYPIAQTLGSDFFEHRHLPRMKADEFICVVELHRKLLASDRDKVLTNSNTLSAKQIINGVALLSKSHLARHTILNYQINDHGSVYNSISFRAAYDSIVLLEKLNNPILIEKDKKITAYFNVLAIFFEDVPKAYASTNFTTRFYRFKLRNLKFYKFWNKTLKSYIYMNIVLKRIPMLLTNKAYRKALFRDRKRVLELIKSFYTKRL